MTGCLACLEMTPTRLRRHPEDVLGPVFVGVLRVGSLVLLGLEPGVHLLECVGDVLEEDEPENDVLVLGRIHRAAQSVGHAPQLGLVARRGALIPSLGGRGLRRQTGHRWRCLTTTSLQHRGWPDEARDEIRLLPAGIVEAERPAQLLQTIAGEFRQHLVEPDLPGIGQSVDKPGLYAAVIDVQFVVVGTSAEFLGGQLGEDGAFRQHWSASLILPCDGAAAISAWTSTAYRKRQSHVELIPFRACLSGASPSNR